MRLIETGECLARLRDTYPDFYEDHHSDAWNKLVGLRNIIAHRLCSGRSRKGMGRC